ncbi:family 10 glycosylhydrolase [Anabaena sphaerica FACHB-251]|uniref:Family 10 glycosylhydrolase n=1 Tax=Anabaena sphaerica FACHB-251 TaxID=2692883 RepID=A0A926WHH8_9NOST|nr:family 10 glycosylhydrolase [Anabaena sphaerica]MBD2294654.1 family 10 glycosylhydrolase [Anabaena sphaerica FACHB-251]
MPPKKQEPKGCGCANIPLSLILAILGGGYWWFSQKGNLDISHLLAKGQQIISPIFNQIPITTSTPSPSLNPTPIAVSKPTPILNQTPIAISKPTPPVSSIAKNIPSNQQDAIKKNPDQKIPLPATPWQKKVIRGIYFSRYQITNNANEKTIRERVKFYRSQGFNTIIHGVWGNGCTMYNSKVMQQTLGYKSCPNLFQDQWLDWLIDEAHKQGMEVHAYFEKGIKIDEKSPIFDLAIAKKWIVPGVDKTYPGIDHYVLDVEIPEVAKFFKNIVVEFVQRYPKIDAVQWDDYLGYHAELPGKVDRTAKLTTFVQQMITGMKQANSSVSFDICHHNPYWAKRYFAADWEKWNVDRVFIQVYNDANFKEELNYAKNYEGVAITEQQFHRVKELVDNPAIKSVLVFPGSGKPEETASALNRLIQKTQ